MEGIPIYYVMQPSVDDSLNVFFLPPSYKSQQDVKIKDVVTNFPYKDSGRYFHYRFYALCDKDQKTWVDISNLTAKAPVVDNRILLKVLVVDKPHHTRIFANLYKSSPEDTSARQNNEEQHPRSTSQSSQNQSHRIAKSTSSDSKPAPHPHQRSNLTPPPRGNQTQQQPQPQVPKPTVKSPPARINSAHDDLDLLGEKVTPAKPVPSNTRSSSNTQAHDDINLLGGDHTEVRSTTTTTFSYSGPSNAVPEIDKSVLYNMSREELKNLENQKINAAIQDKLDFANKMWADEDKNKSDKEKAYGEVEDNIKRWSGKNNQRNNIRALLCTVHEVMWTGADWTPLSLSDLMMPAQIKKNYFKAITKFHPDKNQHGDYKQKYIAERVTNELNAAWDEFRKTNP